MNEAIKPDKRFIQANREAVLAIILALLNFVWWYFTAYGFGSQPVEQYSYLLGFPEWFFYSCMLGFVIFSFLMWIMIRIFFKDIPLDAELRQDEGNL